MAGTGTEAVVMSVVLRKLRAYRAGAVSQDPACAEGFADGYLETFFGIHKIELVNNPKIW